MRESGGLFAEGFDELAYFLAVQLEGLVELMIHKDEQMGPVL